MKDHMFNCRETYEFMILSSQLHTQLKSIWYNLHQVFNTAISIEVYRAGVCEGTKSKSHCKFCQHPDADSTMEDVSLPDLPPAETF